MLFAKKKKKKGMFAVVESREEDKLISPNTCYEKRKNGAVVERRIGPKKAEIQISQQDLNLPVRIISKDNYEMRATVTVPIEVRRGDTRILKDKWDKTPQEIEKEYCSKLTDSLSAYARQKTKEELLLDPDFEAAIQTGLAELNDYSIVPKRVYVKWETSTPVPDRQKRFNLRVVRRIAEIAGGVQQAKTETERTYAEVEKVKQYADGVGKQVETFSSGVGEKISKIENDLTSKSTEIAGKLEAKANELGTRIDGYDANLKSLFDTVFKQTDEKYSALGGEIKAQDQKTREYVEKSVQALESNLKSKVEEQVAPVREKVGQLTDYIGMLGDMKNYINTATEAIVGKVSSLVAEDIAQRAVPVPDKAVYEQKPTDQPVQKFDVDMEKIVGDFEKYLSGAVRKNSREMAADYAMKYVDRNHERFNGENKLAKDIITELLATCIERACLSEAQPKQNILEYITDSEIRGVYDTAITRAMRGDA